MPSGRVKQGKTQKYARNAQKVALSLIWHTIRPDEQKRRKTRHLAQKVEKCQKTADPKKGGEAH